MTKLTRACLLSLTVLSATCFAADYRVDTVAEGLEHPWSIAFLADGSKLVTERVGRLRMIDPDGELLSEPVRGLPDDIHVGGQAGLKDVVPGPDFAKTRQLFISYACGTRQSNHLCLGRARLEEQSLIDFAEIFRTQPAKRGSAHYGGRIVFLPDDSLLLTMGDGFDYREQAQDPGNHFGTTLRLDRDGQAPRDNPFVNDPNAADEVYSYGHRNAQGIIHDPSTGWVFSNEHGPKGGDEINIIEPGQNYGWPVVTHGVDYTGARITPFTEKEGMVSPLVDWTPSIAPSGLTLYDGELFPEWQGDLFNGALAARKVQRVMMEQGSVTGQESLFSELGRRIRDVRTGPEGALYLLTDHANGEVLRVVPAD